MSDQLNCDGEPKRLIQGEPCNTETLVGLGLLPDDFLPKDDAHRELVTVTVTEVDFRRGVITFEALPPDISPASVIYGLPAPGAALRVHTPRPVRGETRMWRGWRLARLLNWPLRKFYSWKVGRFFDRLAERLDARGRGRNGE